MNFNELWFVCLLVVCIGGCEGSGEGSAWCVVHVQMCMESTMCSCYTEHGRQVGLLQLGP